jgi:hypothetical protein
MCDDDYLLLQAWISQAKFLADGLVGIQQLSDGDYSAAAKAANLASHVS